MSHRQQHKLLVVTGDSTVDAAIKTALPLDAGPVRVVHVERRPHIEEVRGGLPITGMEQEVMEALLHNDVVVLCGETGCGKTTQVCHSCCTVMLCSPAAYEWVDSPSEWQRQAGLTPSSCTPWLLACKLPDLKSALCVVVFFPLN